MEAKDIKKKDLTLQPRKQADELKTIAEWVEVLRPLEGYGEIEP